MKTCLLAIFAFLLAVPAAAQKTARVFDNFDRSQGVPIYRESEPASVVVPTKRRVKRNGKWVVITEDKLVKKTGSSAPSVRVTDGVSRSTQYTSFGKLRMGTGTSLKGFTTGVPAHDKFIEDA